MRVVPLLVAVLLAGCNVAPDGGDTNADLSGTRATDETGGVRMVCVDEQIRPSGEPDANGTCPVLPPPTIIVEVSFEGNLGTSIILCEATSGQCVPPTGNIVGDETDHYHEEPGATLTAVNLTLTWTPTTAATDTLGLGAMRMGTNNTLVGNAEGLGPLTLQAEGLDLPLDQENLVHIYVYNVRGLVHNPPVFGYASLDEDFLVEGTLTFSRPATCGPSQVPESTGGDPPIVRCISAPTAQG